MSILEENDFLFLKNIFFFKIVYLIKDICLYKFFIKFI